MISQKSNAFINITQEGQNAHPLGQNAHSRYITHHGDKS